MYKLKIITSSTRPGRKGIAIAEWLTERSREQGKFDVELLDLARINLPFMDEPNHPRLQKYENDHTTQWSATIDSADAFVVVLCEYNYGFSAPIKNAFDYLFKEWMNKPISFISYGGLSGGMRSLQMIRQVVSAFKMLVADTVSIPFFAKSIDESGNFVPDDKVIKSVEAMLDDIERYCEVSKRLRSQMN